VNRKNYLSTEHNEHNCCCCNCCCSC